MKLPRDSELPLISTGKQNKRAVMFYSSFVLFVLRSTAVSLAKSAEIVSWFLFFQRSNESLKFGSSSAAPITTMWVINANHSLNGTLQVGCTATPTAEWASFQRTTYSPWAVWRLDTTPSTGHHSRITWVPFQPFFFVFLHSICVSYQVFSKFSVFISNNGRFSKLKFWNSHHFLTWRPLMSI